MDRIWLQVYYNKIPIYPVFYLLKGESGYLGGVTDTQLKKRTNLRKERISSCRGQEVRGATITVITVIIITILIIVIVILIILTRIMVVRILSCSVNATEGPLGSSRKSAVGIAPFNKKTLNPKP